MRWKAPQLEPNDTVIWLLFWWAIIPMVAVLLVVIWLPQKIEEIKRHYLGPYPDHWQNWFAWRPVRWSFFHSDVSGWVWLETVERRLAKYSSWGTDYRPCDSDGGLAENGEAG